MEQKLASGDVVALVERLRAAPRRGCRAAAVAAASSRTPHFPRPARSRRRRHARTSRRPRCRPESPPRASRLPSAFPRERGANGFRSGPAQRLGRPEVCRDAAKLGLEQLRITHRHRSEQLLAAGAGKPMSSSRRPARHTDGERAVNERQELTHSLIERSGQRPCAPSRDRRSAPPGRPCPSWRCDGCPCP